MNDMKYLVCNGDVDAGFRFYGVFDTYEEATWFGKENFDYSGFTVIRMYEKGEK